MPGELRLLDTILLNSLVLACAAIFVRRRLAASPVQKVADTLLLSFAVQYISVTLPGLLGLLTPLAIAATALILCAALCIASLSPRPTAVASPLRAPDSAPWHFWTTTTSVLLVVSLLIAVAWVMSHLPILAEDALTYHFPAAVQWLRDRRISLYETWFFNPANTYSPLAGSTFIAWLMAPMGSDILARFVQLPPLLLIFVLIIELCRSLGSATPAAVLIAAATIFCPPFISQVVLAKDDLFVAAFFLAAWVGFSEDRLKDPLAPWRIGLALGLMLATKYTALLSLPVFLVLLPAPRRSGWRWRQWGGVLLCVALLAGPWFLRNWLSAGNPLYPVNVRLGSWTLFHGMFTPGRSIELHTLHGIWNVIALRQYSPGPWIVRLLAIAYLAALVGLRPRRPISSAWSILLAPLIGMGTFIFFAPYPEFRFTLPSLALLFACAALAARRWLGSAQVAACGLLAAASLGAWATGLGTDLVLQLIQITVPLTIFGLVVTLWRGPLARLKRDAYIVAGLIGAAAVAVAAYVFWPAYTTMWLGAAQQWRSVYPAGGAWIFVRQKLPDDAPLAYTNMHTVYPLFGPEDRRPVVYIPTRKDVEHLCDLGRFSAPVAGEQMLDVVTAALHADPDRDVWLARLKGRRIEYLLISREAPDPKPPELLWAAADPARFHPVYDDPAAIIYQVLNP